MNFDSLFTLAKKHEEKHPSSDEKYQRLVNDVAHKVMKGKVESENATLARTRETWEALAFTY